MDGDNNTKISVEVSSKETVIHIPNLLISDVKAFDKAYKKARILLSRIPHLDDEVKNEIIIEKAKERTERFWTSDGEETVLGMLPKKPEYRVAISLLRVHPVCKTEADVVKEIGIPQPTAHVHLQGKRKSTKEFFAGGNTGFSLTFEGVSWLINTILPELGVEIEQE